MHITPMNRAEELTDQQLEEADDFEEHMPGLLMAGIGTGIAVLLLVLNFI